MPNKNLVYVHSDTSLELLLKSIQSYLQYNNGLTVYVFAANEQISAIQKEFFKGKLDEVIVFRTLHSTYLLKEARNTSGLPVETLYRLLLPLNIKEPILYVDYDTFCVGPIAEFRFESIISAVPDLGEAPTRNSRMNIDCPRQYFNAGVLFWRLDLLNEEVYLKELKDILCHSNYEHDQDILNIMYLNKYYSLARSLNYSPLMFFRDRILYPKNLRQQIGIRIIHAVGPMKPWLKPFPRRLRGTLPVFEHRKWNLKALRYLLRYSL